MKNNRLFFIGCAWMVLGAGYASDETVALTTQPTTFTNTDSNDAEYVFRASFTPTSRFYYVTGTVSIRDFDTDIPTIRVTRRSPGGGFSMGGSAMGGGHDAVRGDDGRLHIFLGFGIDANELKKPGDPLPDRIDIEIKALVPPGGNITLSPLTMETVDRLYIVKPENLDVIVKKDTAWFSERGAGWAGGILGGGIGVLGGLFGTLGGLLIPKGKGRRLIMGMAAALFALGLGLTLTGLYALVTGQPRHVWYAFLLPGGLLTILTPVLRNTVRNGYAQAELRKMQAQDA